MLDAKPMTGTTDGVVTPGTGRLAHAPASHPPVRQAKIGILVANLGTPDNYDYWSMRRYLNEFLSDKRVVDYSAWIWQPLLQLVILSKRPSSSGANYKLIWNHEKNESPLLTITKDQTRKIAETLKAKHLYALRQSVDRIEGPRDGRCGLRKDPVLPALPPLRRCHLGHRE